MHRFAYAEARDQLGSALELLGALPATIDRDRAESLLRLDDVICTTFHDLGRFMNTETVQSLERAYSLCHEHGKDTHHCDVLSTLAFVYANRGEVEKGRGACEELLTVASELNDADMIGRAHFRQLSCHCGVAISARPYKRSTALTNCPGFLAPGRNFRMVDGSL
jgi:hypothetical protein